MSLCANLLRNRFCPKGCPENHELKGVTCHPFFHTGSCTRDPCPFVHVRPPRRQCGSCHVWFRPSKLLYTHTAVTCRHCRDWSVAPEPAEDEADDEQDEANEEEASEDQPEQEEDKEEQEEEEEEDDEPLPELISDSE
jgi:hypothetical protein